MALTTGSVSIAANGGETTSGAAGRLYAILKATAQASFAAAGESFPSGPSSEPLKSALAATANDFAAWLVTEITTYAEAVIETSDSGLQRTPNPNNADTNTQGPSAQKTLAIQ